MIATEKFFSYGTLQQKKVQLATFGRELEGVADKLIGYRLSEIEITDQEVLARSEKKFHPILILSGDPTDEVSGTIFDITLEELHQADAYEVNDYMRIKAPCRSGMMVWVYVEKN